MALKLTIELVPSTSWYNNMRKVLSPQEWDKVRKKSYEDYGHRCGICGASGRLNCHEIWAYDDQKHIQKLNGFIALCDLCHHVKHICLAGILANKGQLDFENLIRHFMAVNACTRKIFDEHHKDAFEKWHSRSRYQWTVDFGEYARLINK
jgi:hypothetical protein